MHGAAGGKGLGGNGGGGEGSGGGGEGGGGEGGGEGGGGGGAPGGTGGKGEGGGVTTTVAATNGGGEGGEGGKGCGGSVLSTALPGGGLGGEGGCGFGGDASGGKGGNGDRATMAMGGGGGGLGSVLPPMRLAAWFWSLMVTVTAETPRIAKSKNPQQQKGTSTHIITRFGPSPSPFSPRTSRLLLVHGLRPVGATPSSSSNSASLRRLLKVNLLVSTAMARTCPAD